MRKVVLILICLTFGSCHSTISQVDLSRKLSKAQYNVINDLFGNTQNSIVYYHRTSISKTWGILMQPIKLDELFGPPCNTEGELIKWENMITDKEFELLRSKIKQSIPLQLEKNKLSRKIILESDFDSNEALLKEVIMISNPFIINKNYAVIKKSSLNNEQIIIATNKSGKWKPVCMKWILITTDN